MMKIAKSSSPTVTAVNVMNGGRELRITVAGLNQGGAEENSNTPILSLQELPGLAASVADEIEATLTYAGQIRVTVIQESRATSSVL